MRARLKTKVVDFVKCVSGATLVEYGIALLVVIIVGGATLGALATAVGNEISETTSAF
jgi:Flp pilus assembly pilin Flp